MLYLVLWLAMSPRGRRQAAKGVQRKVRLGISDVPSNIHETVRARCVGMGKGEKRRTLSLAQEPEYSLDRLMTQQPSHIGIVPLFLALCRECRRESKCRMGRSGSDEV